MRGICLGLQADLEWNNADSPMAPFGDITPQQVEDVKNLGYRYG